MPTGKVDETNVSNTGYENVISIAPKSVRFQVGSDNNAIS